MNRKKSFLVIAIILILSISSLYGCGDRTPMPSRRIRLLIHSDGTEIQKVGKIQVIATLFPQYDFAKIVGRAG